MEEIPLDLLADAVVVVSADGTVLGLNDRCLALLGLGPESVGAGIDMLVLRDSTGRRIELPPARSPVATRSPERLVEVVDTSGRGRPVAITGRWRGELWTLSARSAGRRRSLDASGSELVATVSHELRSPLATVKGFTSTLLARWERFSDDQKLTMLRTIEADADRVTRLLNDLLEVARIDAGQVRLASSVTDVGSLVRTVAAKAELREDAVGRELLVHVEPGTPAILVDADRIEQVLTNLVDNALQHVRNGPVTVEVDTGDGGVVIAVCDEGPGIPRDQHEAIFRRFGRGRSARRAGTGLGLYIARGLTEAHGGRLTLDAGQGTGSRFTVWLPARPPDTTS